MMGTLILLLTNFSLIGLLPRIFFRQDGKFNSRWWMTAAPLFAAPAVLLLVYTGRLEALSQSPLQEALAVLLGATSIGLMAFTLGTHRVPLALWHQENDAPRSIVTWGAYKRIRHPFYASFIVALSAALVYAPHVLTLAAWIMGYAVLN